MDPRGIPDRRKNPDLPGSNPDSGSGSDTLLLGAFFCVAIGAFWFPMSTPIILTPGNSGSVNPVFSISADQSASKKMKSPTANRSGHGTPSVLIKLWSISYLTDGHYPLRNVEA